jgi:hypothetical protein
VDKEAMMARLLTQVIGTEARLIIDLLIHIFGVWHA